MSSCVFCRIVQGEIPAMKVYEDERTLAFMDIAGDVDGHILVVPKRHVNSILDCDEAELSAVMRTVRLVSRHLTENCGYSGVNLLNASGESAGQSVPHFHIHIIPRKENDLIDARPSFGGAKKDIGAVFERLRIGETSAQSLNEQTDGAWFKLRWEEGAEIGVESGESCAVVSANRAGLLSLADQMSDLAQGSVGGHIHYDEHNSLEEGSDELVIVLKD